MEITESEIEEQKIDEYSSNEDARTRGRVSSVWKSKRTSGGYSR
jgi:hypothetical protein